MIVAIRTPHASPEKELADRARHAPRVANHATEVGWSNEVTVAFGGQQGLVISLQEVPIDDRTAYPIAIRNRCLRFVGQRVQTQPSRIDKRPVIDKRGAGQQSIHRPLSRLSTALLVTKASVSSNCGKRPVKSRVTRRRKAASLIRLPTAIAVRARSRRFRDR